MALFLNPILLVKNSFAKDLEPLIYRPKETIEIDQLKNVLKASKPVIFLPGVMGSRLADPKGNVLWGKSIWKMRREFDRLALTCDGKEDDIKPIGLVNELLVLGKFLKIKQYSEIVDFFSKIGINESAGNLLLFPYDWRKSNAETAKDLKKKIEDWTPVQKNPRARFTLIAHSMGGLVAQYYINKLGGDRRIDKLILLGTPNYGSLKGLKMILGGLDDEVNTLIGEDRVRKAIVTFPSAYQLLPRYKSCCQIEKDGAEETLDLFDIKNWKKLKWINAVHLSENCGWSYIEKQLQDAQDFHHSLDGVEKKVKIFKIVGFTQKTLERIVFEDNGKEKRLASAEGDGTVLEVSAARGGFYR
jgi:pimeloyl-ACP methyl ester carboxylesterase